MGNQHAKKQESHAHNGRAQSHGKHNGSYHSHQHQDHRNDAASKQSRKQNSKHGRHGGSYSSELQDDSDTVMGVNPDDPYDIFPQPRDAYGLGQESEEEEEEDEYESYCEMCERISGIITVVLAFVLGLLIAVVGLSISVSEGFEINSKLASSACQSDLRWHLSILMVIGKLMMLGSCCGGCGIRFESIPLLVVFAIVMVLLGFSLAVMAWLLGSEIDQVWAPVTRAVNYICQDPQRTKQESQKYGLSCATLLSTSLPPLSQPQSTMLDNENNNMFTTTSFASSVSTTSVDSSASVVTAACMHESTLGGSSSEIARDDFIQSLDSTDGCALVDRLCENVLLFDSQMSCACSLPTSFYVPLGQKTGTYCSAWDVFSDAQEKTRWCFVADGVTCGNVAGTPGSQRSDGPCGPNVEPRSAMSANDFTYLSIYQYLAWIAAVLLTITAVAALLDAFKMWQSHRERSSYLVIQDSPKSVRETPRKSSQSYFASQPYEQLTQDDN
eukprot:gnl/MRDRNA2_/MRDRNA2_62662_c0_seq1.p1 gnl/MRDRNA2_/MRDRNA2_62662_c0~~gnl/MRDRNA2_/MRDRNA2_62662_c0_seq1.p1  ORF type:complete len:499 (-),score=74.02 gnl/MRDRNA2_/MRDRNA2_62662_c0_seq1:11-1507(-)